jgi:hypothetical protein
MAAAGDKIRADSSINVIMIYLFTAVVVVVAVEVGVSIKSTNKYNKPSERIRIRNRV